LKPELSAIETRIIGCLIEKEITTPDNYPLTLNALLHAANQKSNRDPVLDLTESEVEQVLAGLMKKHLVTDRSGAFGGRVTRYRHRFCNTQFGELAFSPEELAVLCELFLRGPQTPGELRSRAKRMAPLANVSEVDTVLAHLAARDEPLVRQLPREPGRREARWAHLFGTEPPAAPPETAPKPMAARSESPPSPSGPPVDSLREQVDRLRADVQDLRARLEALERRP
jgi:uncharacterized protein YceH (UPF0502 family)